jgi:RecG-like helicase
MKKMTRSLIAGVATLLMLALVSPAFAADKSVTVTGEGKCAKCSLKEADKCQNVIQVEKKNGKTVNYYLVQNDISKAFHENICKESKKVTATGTVKKEDGKMMLTAEKIEVVK